MWGVVVSNLGFERYKSVSYLSMSLARHDNNDNNSHTNNHDDAQERRERESAILDERQTK